jgi:clan AA aspartic protease (TIGR02281 family)
MRKSRQLTVSCVAGLAASILLSAAHISIADDTAAKAALAAKGIRASHGGLSLQEEGELAKAVKAAEALKRKIPSDSSGSDSSGFGNNADVQAEIAERTERVAQLKQELAQLNAAPIGFKGPAQVKLNQEISQNETILNQLQQSMKESGKAHDDSQKDIKAARDAYYQAVFDARKMADRVLGQYSELSKDPEVVTAVKAWNEASHSTHGLKPSHPFDSALKKLEALEKKIPSQKIALKQEGTAYSTSVAINDVMCDMMVDAAAPSVLLPHQTALDAGVKVDDAAGLTPFQGADGSEVQAHRVVLKTVRVGSFMARNVSCGVFPASNKSAKAVLGKSFLGQFKGKVDSFSGDLQLVRSDTEGSTRRRKKPAAKHTARKSSKAAQSDEPQE